MHATSPQGLIYSLSRDDTSSLEHFLNVQLLDGQVASKLQPVPVSYKKMVLVCTHMSRDKRCGRAGPQVRVRVRVHVCVGTSVRAECSCFRPCCLSGNRILWSSDRHGDVHQGQPRGISMSTILPPSRCPVFVFYIHQSHKTRSVYQTTTGGGRGRQTPLDDASPSTTKSWFSNVAA